MRPGYIPLARRRFQLIASTVACALFGVVSVTAAADPVPDVSNKAPREQVATPSDAPPGPKDAVEPADTSATEWFYPALAFVSVIAMLFAAEGLAGPRPKRAEIAWERIDARRRRRRRR